MPKKAETPPAAPAAETVAEAATETPRQPEPSITKVVKVSRLVKGLNPRTYFNPDKMASLKRSIETHNRLIEPIVVRSMDPDDETCELPIVAGERRFICITELGWEYVTVVVMKITEVEAVEMALSENIDRDDLNPIEEGNGFLQLQKFGQKQGEIGERFGKSQSWVANTIRLTTLPEVIRDQIADGSMERSYGVSLAAISEYPEKLIEIAKEAMEAVPQWTVKQLHETVQKWKKDQEAEANPSLDLDIPPPAGVNHAGRQPALELVEGAGEADPTPPARIATPEEERASMDALAGTFGGYASDSQSGDQAPEESTSSSTDVSTDVEGGPAENSDPEGDGAEAGGADTTSDTPDAAEADQAPPADASPNPAAATVTPAASAPKASTPAEPAAKTAQTAIDKKTADSAPQVPATAPAMPEGWTNAPVIMKDYEWFTDEAGLWPLAVIKDRIIELEAAQLSPAAMAMAEMLAKYNRDHGSIFVPAEADLLEELFANRETVSAAMIAELFITRRFRTFAEAIQKAASGGALDGSPTAEEA